MSYTSTGGLPTIPRLAVAGVDEGAPGSASSSSGSSSGSSDPLTLTPRVTPAAPASGLKLYADATGKLSWIRASDGFTRSFEVTATTNRTFTIPDASFTLAGQNLANTFTLANTFSANGALSAPAVSITGAPVTGGTATTTKPLVLVETAGATSTSWSTAGTMLGVNAPSGFSTSGNLIDAQLNGLRYFSVAASGTRVANASLAVDGTITLGTGNDQFLSRKAAANLQLGAADAAAPVAQTLSVQSVVAGTTDTAGAAFTHKMSAGTGTGAGGSYNLQVAPSGSTGSSQNTFSTVFRVQSDGLFILGSAGSSSAAPQMFPFSGSTVGTQVISGKGLGWYSYANTAGDIGFSFSGSNMSQTSGTQHHFNAARTFAPTSGTGVYNHLSLQPTINQTGGANGITRGLYIAPTLTAVADFRAIEVSAGDVVMPAGTTGMTSGFPHMPAAAGAPSGTPSARTGNVPFYYDTTNNKLYVYNGAWKSVTLA